jgi:hypothetical protein
MQGDKQNTFVPYVAVFETFTSDSIDAHAPDEKILNEISMFGQVTNVALEWNKITQECRLKRGPLLMK